MVEEGRGKGRGKGGEKKEAKGKRWKGEVLYRGKRN